MIRTSRYFAWTPSCSRCSRSPSWVATSRRARMPARPRRPPQGEVVVESEPPPPPPPEQEVVPASPGPEYVWIGGYHRWDGHRYVWVRGRYDRRPHANARWTRRPLGGARARARVGRRPLGSKAISRHRVIPGSTGASPRTRATDAMPRLCARARRGRGRPADVAIARRSPRSDAGNASGSRSARIAMYCAVHGPTPGSAESFVERLFERLAGSQAGRGSASIAAREAAAAPPRASA